MRALMNILLNIWRGLLLHHPHGVSQAVVVRLWQHLVQKIGIGSSCWGRGQRMFWFWGVFAWWTLSNESMRGGNNRVLIIYVLKLFSLLTCTLRETECGQGIRTDYNHIPTKTPIRRSCSCRVAIKGPRCTRCGYMCCCSCKCHREYSQRFRFYNSKDMENLRDAVSDIVNASGNTWVTMSLNNLQGSNFN